MSTQAKCRAFLRAQCSLTAGHGGMHMNTIDGMWSEKDRARGRAAPSAEPELKWTTEKPTRSGLYWMWWQRNYETHSNDGMNLIKVDVENNVVTSVGSEMDDTLEERFSMRWVDEQEFYGPIASITPPERRK